MQKKFFDKKIFNRKIIILLSVVVCIVVVIALFSNSLKDVVKEAVKPDESKLSQTYNASRYFFRVGYPDTWYVEKDANGFGFQKDTEKGLVIRMLNTKDSQSVTGDSPSSSATAGNSGADSSSLKQEYTTVINFLYRGLENDQKIERIDACKRYMDDFVSGKMFGDEYKVEYQFSSINDFTADNLTFSYVTYRCEVYGRTVDANGTETVTPKPIEVLNGEIHVATRKGAYYAVNFESSLDTASAEFNDYRKDFINILNDFRFSVFDD